MTYTAWSDGSYSEEKGSFAAYIIEDDNNERIASGNYKLNGVQGSFNSETVALFLLLKEIENHNLANVKIFVDEKGLSKKVKMKSSHVYLGFKEKINVKFLDEIVLNVEWKRRAHNKAHMIIKEKSFTVIDNFFDNFTFWKAIHKQKEEKRKQVAIRRELRKIEIVQ